MADSWLSLPGISTNSKHQQPDDDDDGHIDDDADLIPILTIVYLSRMLYDDTTTRYI